MKSIFAEYEDGPKISRSNTFRKIDMYRNLIQYFSYLSTKIINITFH